MHNSSFRPVAKSRTKGTRHMYDCDYSGDSRRTVMKILRRAERRSAAHQIQEELEEVLS